MKGAATAMNKRQYEILKILYDSREFITLGELADRINVSVKTVRNDIASIKEYLSSQNSGEIEARPHTGIRLIITEDEWLSLTEKNDDEEREIIFFIIRHLFKNNSLTVQRLAQQYYIGRSTLEKIIQKIESWFDENHITFKRQRGKGISIEYSEFNYRMALLNFYTEYSDMYAGLVNVSDAKYAFINGRDYAAMCAALDGFEADSAAKAIIETEQQFGLTFNYLSGINLLFLTSLCIVRTKKDRTVKMPEVPSCYADCKTNTMLAEDLSQRIEKQFGILLPKQETDFLTFAIAISEIQEFESTEARRFFETSNAELCRFTVRAVKLLSEIAGVDLKEDVFFVKQMNFLIKASISRMKYGVLFKNGLLSQIKAKYPNMMALAWLLGNLFEKELGLEINEHEVGYLALNIGGAIERHMFELTACIVCDYGIGISQILKEKITRTIPELKITSVFSGRDINKIRDEQCDFIISTTPLSDSRINRDIVEIGHLLSDKDIRLLEEYMKKIRVKKHGEMKNIAPHSEIFKQELIFPKRSLADKNELLHMMCSKLESLGYVTKDFEKSVFEREKSTSTDIGKGFAIPHGLSKYVNHSVAAFASLEKPVVWTGTGETADLIFLLAFDLDENERVKEEIIKFYKSVVSFMEDSSECEKLRCLNNKEKLLEIFKLW